MPRSSLALVAGAAASLVAACGDGTVDPHHPGKFLGTYHVDAKREATTCGEGALGSTASWSFDVRLSRDEGAVFWDNGAEVIAGALAPDDVTFSFTTGVVVDMRDESSAPWLPPCSIARGDGAEGVLAADTAGFTGKLTYDFSPTQGSDCTDLVAGSMPVFAALPCAMRYTLSGVRTKTEP
jgi:hypothetical protein